jgi:hypothetical protein
VGICGVRRSGPSDSARGLLLRSSPGGSPIWVAFVGLRLSVRGTRSQELVDLQGQANLSQPLGAPERLYSAPRRVRRVGDEVNALRAA